MSKRKRGINDYDKPQLLGEQTLLKVSDLINPMLTVGVNVKLHQYDQLCKR